MLRDPAHPAPADLSAASTDVPLQLGSPRKLELPVGSFEVKTTSTGELRSFARLNPFDHGCDDHARRTRWLTERLCISSGMTPSRARLIANAAQIHDIGKGFMPNQILEKPGALSAAERATIQRHAKLGAQYLRTLGQLFDVELHLHISIAHSHHERWDGLGYPCGLAGASIPFPARITAVADVFDALASERSYKRAWPLEDVFAYIESEADRHFDPQCVRALLRCAHDIRRHWASASEVCADSGEPDWVTLLPVLGT
ncbi:MAG: HD domain-containing phosphohydrolase [Burkholderiaceae bacterium]|jgi:putative two-component system response regulator